MSWDYRVFENTFGELEIREVYYSKDQEICAISDCTASPAGVDVENLLADLKGDLQLMLLALDKPILNYEEVVSRGESNDGLSS